MSYRLRVILFLALSFVVYGLLGRAPLAAQVLDREASLRERQTALMRRYVQAVKDLDFDEQLSTFTQLRDVTHKSPNQPKLVSIEEIEFVLDDLRKAATFSRDDLALALQQQSEIVQGFESTKQGNHLKAINHYTRSLHLADTLYGPKAYRTVDAQLKLASAILLADGDNTVEGIEAVSSAKQSLEELQLVDSANYREALDVLTKLHYQNEDDAKVMQLAPKAILVFEKAGVQTSPEYSLLTGILAEKLNQQMKHKEALEYARKGLNQNPPKSGRLAPFYLRLLQEYARAKLRMNDFEKVPEAFEEIISVSDQVPGLPSDLRIGYREEYLSALKKMGHDERYNQVLLEVERMKRSATPQKSRYSEE